MIKTNIKVGLFAALLVAMILPFSVMEMADAAPNENANDNAKKANKGQSKKTHQEWIDDGYSIFPGGNYVKQTQKGVDKNKSINDNANNGIDKDILKSQNGKTIIDLDKYMAKEKLKDKKTKTTNTNFPVANGYNTILAISENDAMTYFKAVWDVPASPSYYDSGDTIFTFNAIQPFGVGSSVIFQPVLQYGSNGPCPNNQEGEFWVYYPLIFVSSSAYNIGDCTPVSVGDELKGYIYKSGSSWYVKTYINGAFDSSTKVGYSGSGDFSSIALETYNLTQNCQSIPGDEEFSQIYIVGDSVAWSDLSSQGAGQWCGMTTKIVSSNTGGSGKVQLNNNN